MFTYIKNDLPASIVVFFVALPLCLGIALASGAPLFSGVIAGIIGVSNIMLFIVKKRTKEIGIQRAIGASPSMIISSIITESVVLTGLAGWIGLVVGVGLLELLSMALEKGGGGQAMFNNPEVDFNLAILSLGILVCAGILAGIIPAKRAVDIKPIDAIRDE